MATASPVNEATFAVNYLGKVDRATYGGISVGGMITQMARHFGYDLVAFNEAHIAGKSKLDMCPCQSGHDSDTWKTFWFNKFEKGYSHTP